MAKDELVFISFIEELYPNQIEGTTVGRIEVYYIDGAFPTEEIRWGCYHNEDFMKFRKEYDGAYLSKKELRKLKKIVAEKFAPELFKEIKNG